MNTVFVTGGSSILGSRVLARLAPQMRVLAATHRRTLEIPGAELELLPGGLERCEEYATQIQGAAVIVHLAAVTHTTDAKQYFFVNTELTKRLLAVCRPGQRFVLVSSQSAHPNGGAYAHSKWLAEEAVRTSGLDFTILRLAQVYGSKSGEGIDGLIAFARRTHLLPDLRHPGSAAYRPIAVEEAAEVIAQVALQSTRPGTNYVLCADRPYTAGDMAVALRKSIRPIFVVPLPVALLRALARLPIPLPFHRDQIDRLMVANDHDFLAAQRDFGFRPRSFLDYLEHG